MIGVVSGGTGGSAFTKANLENFFEGAYEFNYMGEGGWGSGNFYLDGLGSAAMWGVTVGFAAYGIAKLFGADDSQAMTWGFATGGGAAAGQFVYSWGMDTTSARTLISGIKESNVAVANAQAGVDSAKACGISHPVAAEATLTNAQSTLAGQQAQLNSLETSSANWGIGIGLAVAVIIFVVMYKKESQEIITFSCYPWEAPVGGSKCDDCNDEDLPCSEYQCRSLGQACELLNPGTGNEKCTWVHRNDVNPPEISLWEDVLTQDYVYTPDNAVSPPDVGTQIIPDDKKKDCVDAFTPLSFGVKTDEPAKCKLDYLRKKDFDTMDFYFGGSSLFNEEHRQVMSLPGGEAMRAENITLENGGEYSIYVRCQDANGNSNIGNFVFRFCVDDGPDSTAPYVVATSMINGMPIVHNQSSADLSVYMNEPSECKWSRVDQDYDDMETAMTCATKVEEINARMTYPCSTKLTGLKSNEENKFYFRCKDQPSKSENERNVNAQSYEFSLIGTQPLVISSVEPNGTVRDSTPSVKVTLEATTSAGHEEGKSICSYSETGNNGDYITFLNTDSHEHTQDLYLADGTYKYYIKCVDLGGNYDVKIVNFKVQSDSSPPTVVRAYHEETYLKIITNEKAECVYSTDECNYLFDDGIKMSNVDDTKHFTDWNTRTTLYVKCRDEYGSQPAPNVCSIIVRAFESY